MLRFCHMNLPLPLGAGVGLCWNNSLLGENNKNDIEIKESIKYYKMFFNPIFFIVSIATFLSYFCCWYMQPVMSIRLDEFDLSIFWIGAFFAISPLTYTISSLMITWFTDRVNDKFLIHILYIILKVN